MTTTTTIIADHDGAFPSDATKTDRPRTNAPWAWLLSLSLALGLGACDTGDDGMGDDGSNDDATTEAGTEGDDTAGDDTGEDGGADDSGDGNASEDDGSDDGSAGAPTFEVDIAPILSANCSCHGSGAGGLTLGDGAFDALVGVDATGAALAYVEPGDVESSYLVYKLRGTQGDVGGGGGVMPPGGALSDDDIELVEAWIEAGAQ